MTTGSPRRTINYTPDTSLRGRWRDRPRDIATPNVKKIARASIRKKEESGSEMVDGLTAMLTDGELADLIAYLSALKKE